MNRITLYMLAALMLLTISVQTASAQVYTDEQVYKMVIKEQEKGATRAEIVTKLMKSGVKIDQIRRMAKKYNKLQAENKIGLKDSDSKKGGKRTRVNNGDKRQEGMRDPVRDRSGYTAEDYEDEEKQTQREYSDALDMVFPDSMKIYREEGDSDKAPKVFGRDIFNNKKLTFETDMNIATPADYRLGPGDEVYIDVYGASQNRVEATVSPEGTVDIPEYGPVSVGGMTVDQATAKLRSTLGSRYADSKIRLTVGQTKTITIQVMGAVKTPGSYTVSAFATVFHALYLAGGTSDIGTLRNIKVYRKGKLVSTVDIYDYILNGKMSGNIRLHSDDIIIVDPYDCLVCVSGKVKRPMYYEMKKEESVETLLHYAGGFSGDAYRSNVRLTRKNGTHYSVYTIDEFERPSFKVLDGDSLSVDSVIAKFDNMVMVKGAVMRPGMYEIGKSVKTVRDLIAKADGLAPKAVGSHAVLRRRTEDESLTTMSLNIDAILSGTSPDVALQNEDVVYIMSKELAQDEQTLTIYGEVMYPGVYDYASNTTIGDFIVQAGGLKDAASLTKIDISRRIRDNKATNTSQTIAHTFSLSLRDGKLLEGDTAFVLQPFDEVYVRRSPGYVAQKHVTIIGEIAFPGEYTLSSKAQRLSDIIKQAGGLTQNAYSRGAQLRRTLTYDEQMKQETLIKMLYSGDSINAKKIDLSNVKTVGINLDKAIANAGSDQWDIVLEEGDVITIPQYKNTISVNGEVMYPTMLAYNKDANLNYYIDRAGGFSDKAKRNKTFVINLNGTVKKVRSAKDIQPGSEIVVPSKSSKNRMSTSELIGLGTMTASLASILAVILK